MREFDLRPTPGGLRLRACTWGEPAEGRLPVLILHGFLEQGASWDLVAPHLPGQVVAPDMRGHGLSEHVGTGGFYHFWDYVPDVVGLIDHLGGRVDLVGHSMGGTISVLLAALRPGRVRRLVNVEGFGPPDATGQDAHRASRFLDAMLDPPGHAPIASVDEAADRMLRWNDALPRDFARRLAARVTRPRDDGEGLTWTWDPLHRARAPYPFRAGMFRDFLARITCPVLYISGGRSRLKVPDQAEREASVADLRTVTIPEAGHMIHQGHPERLAELIASFFSAQDVSSWTPT